MSPLPLLILTVFLLARLPLYFQDNPISLKQCGIITVVPVMLLMVFEPQPWVMITAIFLVVINLVDYLLEHTTPWIHLARTIPGFFTAILTAVLMLPAFPAALRPCLLQQLSGICSGPATASGTKLLYTIMIYLIGLLLAVHEMNLLIRHIIEIFELRPPSPDIDEPRLVKTADTYSRGRIIGALERIIIFFLVTQSQFMALGLIITAKGLARFEDLKRRDFSEYFLVGTLLSICLAGAMGILAGVLTHV